jgi:hypothetical protein
MEIELIHRSLSQYQMGSGDGVVTAAEHSQTPIACGQAGSSAN